MTTDKALALTAAHQARTRSRPEYRQALIDLGVSPEEADAQLDASDAKVDALIEELYA